MSSAIATSAQSLSTTFAGGSGLDGNLFDTQAHRDLTITGFGVHLEGNVNQLEIHIRRGGIGGPGWSLADFDLAATYANVATAGSGNETQLPLDLAIALSAGETLGLYITTDSTGASLSYSNGTAVGALYAANADLSIYEGHGVRYPLAGVVNPRVWNGTIYYMLVANALLPFAVTPNQQATAISLDALRGGNAIFDALTQLSDAEIRTALQNLFIDQSDMVRANQFQRLQQAFDDIGSGQALGYSGMADLPQGAGAALWGTLNGSYTQLAGDGNVGALSSGYGGLVAGADGWLGDWRVGAMLNTGTGSATIGSANASYTDLGGGLYAGREFGDLAVKLGAAIIGHNVSSTRAVTAKGLV